MSVGKFLVALVVDTAKAAVGLVVLPIAIVAGLIIGAGAFVVALSMTKEEQDKWLKELKEKKANQPK
jgi:uncharacterized membrane protein YjgN (DUF898 family)